MSELFSVRVAEVSQDSAVLAVRSVHPDSGPPAPTATFALMLLYDPILNSGYSDFRKFTHLEASPLAQAMDRDDYLDPTWVKTNARAFVARAKVTAGELQIWPTHPAWIGHLRKGMKWDTAAYDGGPGKTAEPRAPKPPGAHVERSRDPSAGFRVGTPKLEDCAVKEAFVALHGPNRYVADPVITDPAAMEEATRTMLGQPLLLVPKRGPSEVGTLVELREGGVYVYHESGTGWGAGSHYFRDLRSIGRAWLKDQALPTPVEKPPATAKQPKVAAKKATAKNATARNATAKNATAKNATAKRATAKKATAKNATAKKATAKKATRRG